MKKSQNSLLIAFLWRRWVSPLDALQLVGSMRLASRIFDIKGKGYIVLDKWNKDHKFKLYRIIGTTETGMKK